MDEPPGPSYEPPPVLTPPPPVAETPTGLTSTGRSVFLAKPARDMVQAYDTLVRELVGRSYRVVPDPAADVPRDGSEAIKVIDEALANAELSIHLLGEKAGFAPDGEKKAIVPPAARSGSRMCRAAR